MPRIDENRKGDEGGVGEAAQVGCSLKSAVSLPVPTNFLGRLCDVMRTGRVHAEGAP